MHKIKAVIFDIGGVLVNLKTSGIKFSALMRAMGINPADAFNTYWFASELRQHMTGEIGSEEFYRIAKDRFSLSMPYSEFIECWCDIFEPNREMEPIFHRLAEQYAIGLLSDTDPLHWARISGEYPWIGTAAPSLSFQIGFLKPHPRMFETAAEKCGRQKHECLFIDDKQEHVDGARYHGMQALLFQGPQKLLKDLTGLGIIQT